MAPTSRPPEDLPVAGWREWVQLPALGVEAIKAKLDTGARTSALHAHGVERIRRGGADVVRFRIHPRQRSRTPDIEASAKVLDERQIRSSTGHEATRWVIETPLVLGDETWPMELTLASRDAMGFRLLLGRQALRGRVLVSSGASWLLSRALRKAQRKARRSKTRPRRPS